MPYIHVQVSGTPDDALAARVAAQAMDLTASLLGKDPRLTAVVVDFIPAARWFIAGHPLEGGTARSYHWLVSITDETNTKAEKARYLREVYGAMALLRKNLHEVSYVHLIDARAAAYGYGGLTQEYRHQQAGV